MTRFQCGQCGGQCDACWTAEQRYLRDVRKQRQWAEACYVLFWFTVLTIGLPLYAIWVGGGYLADKMGQRRAMKRHFGLPPRKRGERYPPGCDWPKPPGCDCNQIARAMSCENRCDDSMWEGRSTMSAFWRWMINVAIVVIILLFVLAFTVRANGANLPVPLPAPRVNPSVELSPVIVEAPAKPVPFYCKPLLKFERSCAGVKAASAVMGEKRAKALALRCGASLEEIAQAEACLKQ